VRAGIGVVLGAIVLALPAPARAAVSFGSSLASGSDPVGCSEDECTSTLEDVQGGSHARSPIEGVVVRWRLRTNTVPAPGESVRLRILRDMGSNSWHFVRSSGQFTVAPVSGVHAFDARVRIGAGEYIGLDRPAAMDVFRPAPGAVTNLFADSPPSDGETLGNGGDPGRELLINADVEPDADKDGYGDETQDGCPTSAATQGPCPSSPVGPQGAPSVLDRRDPLLRLAIKRTQDVDKLAVAARMDEDGTLAASGFVQTARVRRRSRGTRSVRLRRVRRAARARRRVTLRLKLARRSLRRVKRAMRSGQLAAATVTITATDRAGNAKRVRRRIRLTP
jgi:hypothetical protein